MLWLYNFGITLYKFLLTLISPFNDKAKLFITGRENIFEVIKNKTAGIKKPVWFHFASLGEFEQGRPVLEEIRKKHPEKGIIITFFSPSGYEIRKDYPGADAVFYLPMDSRRNAAEFIQAVDPEIAIFTKYEFWYHYFKALDENHIPLVLISAIFRPDQIFFKWYGGLHRRMLSCITHFFVQNEQSVNLLRGLSFENVSLSGDTRFDRVAENAASPKSLPLIKIFCGDSPVCVLGSTWPEDELLLKQLVMHYPGWKFIVAPHEITVSHIQAIMKSFPGALKYTDLERGITAYHQQVLVVDNIGMLSAIYQYGKVAYIGGGFGAGIHNTLEAAAFGLPVIFGPKYEKFQEAKDLIVLHAAISIGSYADLSEAFEKLKKDQHAGETAKKYVLDKTGSTAKIVWYLENYTRTAS